MAHSGKNMTCPCGSGKMYQECCGFHEILHEGDCHTINESELKQNLQSAIDHIVKIENDRPMDDFCGLSSFDMSQLLYRPFSSQYLVEFNTNLKEIPPSPFFKLFYKLFNACNENGLKLTAKGNLPRIFCRECALNYFTREEFDEKTLCRLITTEPDFDELHTTHIIARMSGYVRKYKGKLLLTKEGERIFINGISGKDFFNLFKNYAIKFNWGYRDRYPDINIIQMSFLFTIFLLHRYGDVYRSPVFYEDRFLRAFPSALQEVPEDPIFPAEKELKRCYSLRMMERFAWFFGLADFNILEKKYFFKKYELKKTPFLDEFVKFYNDM